MAIVNTPRASEGLRALVGRLLVNFMQPHQLIENLFLRQVFADRRESDLVSGARSSLG